MATAFPNWLAKFLASEDKGGSEPCLTRLVPDRSLMQDGHDETLEKRRRMTR
jgi:hypothetical protein